MKKIFNNHFQKADDGIYDLRLKSKEPQPNSQVSGPPMYYYHPPSTSTSTDSYSHTANSTAGFAQTGAYPTLAFQNQKQQEDKQGFLGKVESTTTHFLGHVFGEDKIVATTNKLNESVTSGHNARELLRGGAVIQLLSKNSRHLLQVVMTSNNVLAFDGNGANNSFNTYFTIEEGEKGRLRFHNNYNYLAFDNKQPCILTLPPGSKNNPIAEFRVHDILGSSELIALESCTCKNHFISISSDGYLKTTNIKDKNIDAQFSVIPITINQQPAYPYQQFNMNPQGNFSLSGPSAFIPPQPPMYYQQPLGSVPPVYSTQNRNGQPSTSAGLYPQIN